MGYQGKSHRHRAEVIEIYQDGAQAAVRFTSGRIECVLHRGFNPPFTIGQKGMVDFTRTATGWEWTFDATTDK